MTRGAFGRIDWMLRNRTWRVIGYLKGSGNKLHEHTIGHTADRDAAITMLRQWHAEHKQFVQYG